MKRAWPAGAGPSAAENMTRPRTSVISTFARSGRPRKGEARCFVHSMSGSMVVRAVVSMRAKSAS
jgi:hypothetical protein